MRFTKLSAVFVTLVVATFALTGCMKFDANLTVSDTDSVSGTVIVAMSKELMAMADDSSSETKTEGLFGSSAAISSAPYDDGKMVGTEYTFNEVPIADFGSQDASSGSLSITRDGDKLITKGNLAFANTGADADMLDNPFASAIMSTIELKMSITYPGKIIDTNGTVVENTVTWTPEFGQDNPIEATVNAPLPGSFPIWIVGVAAGVLLVGVAAFFIIRVRSRKSADLSTQDAVAGEVTDIADAN